MSEVDQPEDAVDHAVAHGHQGQERAEEQTRDDVWDDDRPRHGYGVLSRLPITRPRVFGSHRGLLWGQLVLPPYHLEDDEVRAQSRPVGGKGNPSGQPGELPALQGL